MGCLRYYILVGLMVASAAQAQTSYHAGPGGMMKTTQEARGWQVQIQPLCLENLEHQPRDDVMYQAGTGVDGWVVPSPHLYGEPYHVELEDVRIPMRIPLAEYIENPEDYRIPLDETFIDVGMVTIDEEQVYMNGQPLNHGSEEMRILCEMAEQ